MTESGDNVAYEIHATGGESHEWTTREQGSYMVDYVAARICPGAERPAESAHGRTREASISEDKS